MRGPTSRGTNRAITQPSSQGHYASKGISTPAVAYSGTWVPHRKAATINTSGGRGGPSSPSLLLLLLPSELSSLLLPLSLRPLSVAPPPLPPLSSSLSSPRLEGSHDSRPHSRRGGVRWVAESRTTSSTWKGSSLSGVSGGQGHVMVTGAAAMCCAVVSL